ncbi:MAG: amidase [Rhodospirillales bacterium]|nr:amidase [Rhodospirillales bacterium]
MTELAFLPARKLAAMVRRGEIGCVELLEHAVARVERHDGAINAVVVRDFERARKRARLLDRKGAADAPLRGVPMTVKESFDIAGLPTSWGVVEQRGNIAAGNALAVDRLQAAGAVVFGKTNVPRMLADWQSFNDVYGVTGNPWNLAHSPGGSSGGGAAAVAAGFAALETGSDIGGSIRQPAHACGIFGHKPTWGLLPPRGHSLIAGTAAMTDISVIGPMARSAADLALAFDALEGPDTAETAMSYALPPGAKTLKGLRVAVWPAQEGVPTDAEITVQLNALAAHLKREGAKVSLTARPDFDVPAAFEVYLKLLNGVMSARASGPEQAEMRARAAALSADDTSADAHMLRAVGMSHAEWLGLNERRHRIRRAWSAFFRDWDVLLCPVHGLPALPHRHDAPTSRLRIAVNGRETAWNELLFWPGISCGFHLPASTAPLGLTQAGLPVGVQIVGPLYGDRMTLSVARLLEKSWRRFAPPPGWE